MRESEGTGTPDIYIFTWGGAKEGLAKGVCDVAAATRVLGSDYLGQGGTVTSVDGGSQSCHENNRLMSLVYD